jgi:hypothetical protein
MAIDFTLNVVAVVLLVVAAANVRPAQLTAAGLAAHVLTFLL